MSEIIESAVVELNEKAKGSDLDQTVKYVILEGCAFCNCTFVFYIIHESKQHT